MSEEKVEQSFQVSGPARVRVSNIRGSVDVQPGEDGRVTVQAIKKQDSGDVETTRIEVRQEADGTVVAETRFREERLLSFLTRQPCRIDYMVRVPRACSVQVDCVSADVALSGLEGDFAIRTVSGDLQLKDLTGPVHARSVSGKIVGERLNGALDTDAVSGRVRVTESTLPTIDASSVSGDVVVETKLVQGPFHFKTVSGRVQMTVPESTGCTVDMSSLSGRARTSLPVTQSSRQRGSEHLTIQGGGPTIRFHSVSGDLYVRGPQAGSAE